MKLSDEDLAKLQVKQVANVIRKLNSGKTLTAREEALLAQQRAGALGDAPSNYTAFAATWDDLAQRLGVSRKSIQNWRARPDLAGLLPRPRADGRHDVAAWARAMVELRLARADEAIAPGEGDETTKDWKNYREELTCREIERRIARGDGLLLVASEIEVALGQFLAGVSTALTHLPGSAARFLVGLRDIHVVQAKLQSEIDAVLLRVHAARFLDEGLIREIVAEIAVEGQDAAAIQACVLEALRRIGRRALPAGETAPSPGAASAGSDGSPGAAASPQTTSSPEPPSRTPPPSRPAAASQKKSPTSSPAKSAPGKVRSIPGQARKPTVAKTTRPGKRAARIKGRRRARPKPVLRPKPENET